MYKRVNVVWILADPYQSKGSFSLARRFELAERLSETIHLSDDECRIKRISRINKMENEFLYQLILFILVGLVLAVVIQFIFNHSYKYILLKTCQQFKLLAEEIFLCLIDPRFYEQQFFFERSLHTRKNQLLKSLVTLREIVAEKKVPEENVVSVAEKLEQHFDCLLAILLEISQLRHRVTEANVLQMCQEEMVQILLSVDQLFNVIIIMIRNGINDDTTQHTAIFECAKAIKFFEEKDQHVLRIATPEPMIFILFIASIRDLYNQLITISQLIAELEIK